jgi:hypothetical protein
MSVFGIQLRFGLDFIPFPTKNRLFRSLLAEVINAVFQGCFDLVIGILDPSDPPLVFVENRYHCFLQKCPPLSRSVASSVPCNAWLASSPWEMNASLQLTTLVACASIMLLPRISLWFLI